MLPIAIRLFALGRRITKETRRDVADATRLRYMDPALTPVTDTETETLQMFTRSDGTRNAVEHARKVAHLTGADARSKTAATA